MAAQLPLQATQTVRRAWLLLTTAFLIFALLLAGVGTGLVFFRVSATQPYEATLEATGEVLLQPQNETRFKTVRSGDIVREGDRIRTQPGVQARLVFFDGSELRLAEETSIKVREMRSTRFVTNEQRIALEQDSGWSRLTAVPATTYAVGRFQMRLDNVEIESESRPQAGAELTFELRPLEQLPADLQPLEATVAVQTGGATVRAGGAEVALQAGQRTTTVRTARAAGTPAPAAPSMREFVRNGDFSDLQQAGSELWPRGWVETPHGAGDGDALVTFRQVDGRSVPVILFKRRLAATDYAAIGISQEVKLPLSHFRKLRLGVQFRVLYHSLAGGGLASSEYPVIVKLIYRDRQNVAHQWYRGFYTQNDDKLPTINGKRLEPGEWHIFEQDLLRLDMSPAPVLIESIDIYAAGHDYEAEIASVSIEGE